LIFVLLNPLSLLYQTKKLKQITMKNLNQTLEIVTTLAINFSGSQPAFKISNNRDCVELIDSCSSFIKLLVENKAMLHLHNGVISVNFFN
jgi:hypothetical protein